MLVLHHQQKWREHGALTYAGYILGFPGDTKQSILRDVEIVKRELPVDVLEFFFLTPLPGSEDHKILHGQGVAGTNRMLIERGSIGFGIPGFLFSDFGISTPIRRRRCGLLQVIGDPEFVLPLARWASVRRRRCR